MGRPPLPIGTFGKILFAPAPAGGVRARVYFRDFDGRVRQVSKCRSSRAAAERDLKVELARRQAPASGGAISGATRVSDLADAWLAAAHDWSTGTERTYNSIVRNQVKPALGQLRVQEVTAGAVSRALRRIAERSGTGAAKSTKACLSGMFAMAVEDGALSANPVSESSAKLATRHRSPRALTVAEEERLLELLVSSPRAQELDLLDLVLWMLATGCRIGEGLALRRAVNGEGKPVLDLDAGTWEVNATVVRVPGRGLIVQPRPKTKAGWRVIAIPTFAVAIAKRRLADDHESLVFCSPFAGTLRDPTNVANDLRALLDGFECTSCAGTGYQLRTDGDSVLNGNGRRVRCDQGPWSWVTSHTFRKTVATRLDDAGFTPRQVADHLGHANPSMTLDVYFGRQVVSAEAAVALDRPRLYGSSL